MKHVILKSKKYKYNETHVMTIICSGEATQQLVPLLEHLKVWGNIGHSGSIVVDPDIREGKKSFGFDGDGSSSIKSITVKGIGERK